MFVARERKSVSPSLRLYTKKPVRDYKYNPKGLWASDSDSIPLPPELFPDLRWKDDPLEVDINLTPKSNCLTDAFTVNANGKKVKFAPGNLFWDGSKFDFEKHQYDFPTKWNPKHVGHFFWDKHAKTARANRYGIDGTEDMSDIFFAADDGAIDGYTVLSNDEWDYLFEHSLAKNSSNGKGFIIAGKKCIILKPDKFNGAVADSYTADEWTTAEASGLVALSLAGYRYDTDLVSGGFLWSATPDGSDDAYCAYFNNSVADILYGNRDSGYCVRLVQVQ